MIVRVLDNLAGELDVVLEGLGGAVDHDGGEAAVDAALAQLEGIAVIEVHADGQVKARGLLGVLDGRLDEVHQINVLGILAGTGGNLKDQGSLLFDGGLGDALDDLHVVHVESADGVAAGVRFFEHFGRGYDGHGYTTPLLMKWTSTHVDYPTIPVKNQAEIDKARKLCYISIGEKSRKE